MRGYAYIVTRSHPDKLRSFQAAEGSLHAAVASSGHRSRHQGPDPRALRPGDARQHGEHHAAGGRHLVRGRGPRGQLRLLHRARGPRRAAAGARRSRLHRRVHRGGASRVLPQQPFPRAGSRHGARRPARALLSRARGQPVRLCPGVHRPLGDPRLAAGLLAPPAPRSPTLRREAAAAAPRRAGALEVHRADAAQGARPQDRADARQPRLPVYV